MRIYTDSSLCSFDFWGGATYLASRLTDSELDRVDTELNEIYPDGMEAVQINDLFWFEPEFICELIGLTWEGDEDSVFEREIMR